MINMIVAMDKENGIGKEGKLLTYLREDLQHFRKVTEGHTIIMGMKTYQSLRGAMLLNRELVVLTNREIVCDDVTIVHSVEEVLTLSKSKDIFICGGQSVYEQFMPYADRLFVTHIFHKFDADTYFPKMDETWEISSIQAMRDMIEGKYPFIFAEYHKIKEGNDNVGSYH